MAEASAENRTDLRLHRILTLAAVATYLLLVLFSVTTSSIGISSLRENPSTKPADTLGGPQAIRSDEYMAWTPLDSSLMLTGNNPSVSVLSEQSEVIDRYSSGGFFQTITFWETSTLRTASFLPDGMSFAAYWWLPFLVLALSLPSWLKMLGASYRLGWLATLLIYAAPANWWWSNLPISLLANTVAGCAVMLAAHRRLIGGKKATSVALMLASGIFLASMPFGYVPWGIILSGGVLLATCASILAAGGSWLSKILAIVVPGAVALGLATGTLWEGQEGLEAVSGTVYPGARRVTATAQSLGFILGAPFLGFNDDVSPAGVNSSEISSAPNIVFIVWIAAMLLAPCWAKLRERAAEVVLASWSAVWLLWFSVNLGSFGSKIPLMNRIPPERSVQVIGIIGIIGTCLALSHIVTATLRSQILAGLTATLLTMHSGSLLLQGPMPHLRIPAIMGTSLAVGVCVFLLIRNPNSLVTMIVTCGLAFASVIWVSPIQRGLSDLRNSDAAKYVKAQGEQAHTAGTVWASDSVSVNALLQANAVPSISGRQNAGPDREQWAKLDPTGTQENAWNRGGSRIVISFIEGQPVSISAPLPDVIMISSDACQLARAYPRLTHVISATPQKSSCLKQINQIRWEGSDQHVYEVNR